MNFNGHKYAELANFNCTINGKAMLEFWDDIVLPAFVSGRKRKTRNGAECFLYNVHVIELKDKRKILCGIHVKSTKLVVKSQFTEEEGLIPTDYSLPSAPYSIFIIFLDDHKMAYIKNQAGSPELSSFKYTVDKLLRDTIKENKENDNIKHCLNIVNIPSKNRLEETINELHKITRVKFEFFKLNDSVSFDNVGISMVDEAIQLGADNATAEYKNVRNKKELIKRINKSGEFKSFTIKGSTVNNNNITINNDVVSEKNL